MLATSYYIPNHFSFYNLMLFVHITAAVAAFGGTLSYGLIQGYVMSPEGRRHAAFWHRLQGFLGKRWITPSAVVVLLAGLYLVAAGNFSFSNLFVTLGIIIIVVLLGMGGAYFSPKEEQIAEIAQRDIDASAGGEITFSAEYNELARQLMMAGITANLLVVLAIFLMVMKPL